MQTRKSAQFIRLCTPKQLVLKQQRSPDGCLHYSIGGETFTIITWYPTSSIGSSGLSAKNSAKARLTP
jgi:hypothetical protein